MSVTDRMEHPAQTVTELRQDTTDDMRLVAEVLRKDRKATAEFVSKYSDWVYSYVRRRVMPQTEVAEDLVQEVFVAAWRGLKSYRGDASLRSWLLGIARHKVDDYYRKRLRTPTGRIQMTSPLRSPQSSLCTRSKWIGRCCRRKRTLSWPAFRRRIASHCSGAIRKSEAPVR